MNVTAVPEQSPERSSMHLLWSYLRQYRGLVVAALVLATTNQVFSLLDPLIFRHVIDEYATRYKRVHDRRSSSAA